MSAIAVSTSVIERPILMSAPMVRALIEGRKTQTRRVVKPQPTDIADRSSALVNEAWQAGFIEVHCPYGNPGDRLWVRESFATAGGNRILYYATDDVNGLRKRKPSIHMPRSYSRINLEIVKVRVERIQDISEEDCVAEGIERLAEDPLLPNTPHKFSTEIDGGSLNADTAQKLFAYRWDLLNDKRGFGWDVNPWVWVIEFRHITNHADHANQASRAPIRPGVVEGGTRA